VKILFVNTHFYKPHSYGGMAITLHQLCCGLMHRGHIVAVLAGYRKTRDLFGARNRTDMKVRQWHSGVSASRDSRLGYTVWRTWFPETIVPWVAEHECPDVIVAAGGKVVPVVEASRTRALL